MRQWPGRCRSCRGRGKQESPELTRSGRRQWGMTGPQQAVRRTDGRGVPPPAHLKPPLHHATAASGAAGAPPAALAGFCFCWRHCCCAHLWMARPNSAHWRYRLPMLKWACEQQGSHTHGKLSGRRTADACRPSRQAGQAGRQARWVEGHERAPNSAQALVSLTSRWCGAHWMACLKHFLALSTSPCGRHTRGRERHMSVLTLRCTG